MGEQFSDNTRISDPRSPIIPSNVIFKDRSVVKIDFVDIVGMIFKTTFIEHESPRMTVVRFTRYLKLICLWVRPFSQPKIEDPFVEVLFGLCVATGDYHSNC